MSNFQITPIGVAIIGIYSAIVWFVLVWPISRMLKTSRLRWPIAWLVAIPLLAAPWAEEAWIAWHFGEACKDAGVTVYRQVEVEGYASGLNKHYVKNSISLGELFNQDPTQLASFEKQGFRFYEDLLADGGARHLERTGGRVMVTIRDIPEARYHYKYAYQPEPSIIEEPIGWKLEKIERQVVDSQTGEILGRDISIHRGAPIADALWAQFVGNSMTICPGPNVKPFVPPPPFPQAALKPVQYRKGE